MKTVRNNEIMEATILATCHTTIAPYICGMQNLLPTFIDEEEGSVGATAGRRSGGGRGREDAPSSSNKSWQPQMSSGDSLVKLPRYLADSSSAALDGSVYVPIRQEPIVKTKSVPLLPVAPPNSRYLPVAPDPTPSPLSRHERGSSESPVIAIPLDLIRKKRVQPDKSGDARSLVLFLVNLCPAPLSVFSQTAPSVKFGEIEPFSEDTMLASTLRSVRPGEEEGGCLQASCVVPLLVAPLRVITATLGPQQKIQDFQFRPGPIGMEVELKEGRLICVRVVPNSQSSFYSKSVLGAEVLAVNDVRVMTLQEFVVQVRAAQSQNCDFVKIKMSGFVGARLKNDGFTSFNKKQIKTLFGSLLSKNDRADRLSVDSTSETSTNSTTTMSVRNPPADPVVPPLQKTTHDSVDTRSASQQEDNADDAASKVSDAESELTSSVFGEDFGVGRYQSRHSKKGMITDEDDIAVSPHRVSKRLITRIDSEPLDDEPVVPDGHSARETDQSAGCPADGMENENLTNDTPLTPTDNQEFMSPGASAAHGSLLYSGGVNLEASLPLEFSSSDTRVVLESDTPFKAMGEGAVLVQDTNDRLVSVHVESPQIETLESSNTFNLDEVAGTEQELPNDGDGSSSESSEQAAEELEEEDEEVGVTGEAQEEPEPEEVWEYTTALQSGEGEPLRSVVCAPSSLRCSENGWGDPKSFLHFANFSQEYSVEVSWVDEEGLLVLRRRLRCGERHNEITSPNHVWFVKATYHGRAESRRRHTADLGSPSVGSLSQGTMNSTSEAGSEHIIPGHSDVTLLFRCSPVVLHDHRSTLISWIPWSSVAVAQKLRVSAANSADEAAADSPHVSLLVFDCQPGSSSKH